MKRFGNLFKEIISYPNLQHAFRSAAKGKYCGEPVFEFKKKLHTNLTKMQERLEDHTYLPRPYSIFKVHEPKERVIYAPNFEDVVVQHAVYKIIRPIFDNTFINESFACRPGRGIHLASDYVQKSLRTTGDSYYLQMDIEKYFYSIDRCILKKLIRKKIKDPRALRLIDLFIWYDKEQGIPIGNLLSQLFALIYLNEVDQFIKRELKVKHYCRYMDDFVLFGLSKTEAHTYKEAIEEFLDVELNLKLSKWTIQHQRKGINFAGYRVWSSRRYIRKFSLYTFRRKVKESNLQAIISLLAHARHTSSYTHMLNFLRDENHDIYLRLPETHRHYPLYCGESS